MQALKPLESTYNNLIVLMSTYAKYFALFVPIYREKSVSLQCS